MGGGTKIDFWHDDWLGGALVDILNISPQLSNKLRARVLDFLIAGQWCLPSSFKLAFPVVTQRIESMEIYNKGDTMIWQASMNGEISFK